MTIKTSTVDGRTVYSVGSKYFYTREKAEAHARSGTGGTKSAKSSGTDKVATAIAKAKSTDLPPAFVEWLTKAHSLSATKAAYKRHNEATAHGDDFEYRVPDFIFIIETIEAGYGTGRRSGVEEGAPISLRVGLYQAWRAGSPASEATRLWDAAARKRVKELENFDYDED